MLNQRKGSCAQFNITNWRNYGQRPTAISEPSWHGVWACTWSWWSHCSPPCYGRSQLQRTGCGSQGWCFPRSSLAGSQYGRGWQSCSPRSHAQIPCKRVSISERNNEFYLFIFYLLLQGEGCESWIFFFLFYKHYILYFLLSTLSKKNFGSEGVLFFLMVKTNTI